MPACFLLASCPAVKLTEERKVLLRNTIANIPDGDLWDLVDNYGLLDNCVPPDFDKEVDLHIFDNMRKELMLCIEHVFSDSSLLVSNQFDGMDWTVVQTGGESYGDSPSHLYDSVQACGLLLWDALLKFSKEDYASETH